jgi:protein involved in polysaccharide export with SLBB domain
MKTAGVALLWILLALSAMAQDSLRKEEPLSSSAKAAAPLNSKPEAANIIAQPEKALLTSPSKYQINPGDRLSFRIIEDRDEPKSLQVTDTGEADIPYIGRVIAAGKTCEQLANEIRPLLEKDYYFRATVVIGLDTINKIRGKVYVTGQVRTQGPQEIPNDETFTVSKAILRAGGFGDFADKRKVKLVRKKVGANDKTTTTVDVSEILEKGKTEKDPVLQPEDLIIVPQRLINF